MPDTDPHIADREDFAILAHEVRGALTVISGFTELLGRQLSAAERQQALDGIRHAVRRIDALIASAKHARLNAAEDRSDVHLAELANRVIAEQAAVTGRTITLNTFADPIVNGEPDALERALVNLIDNALKFSLASSEVEVETAQEKGRAVLRVCDRGPGIPHASHEVMFEPFERLVQDETPGTGLGLTVVRDIVHAHGGSVSAMDRTGGGTVFTLELPVAGEQPDSAR